MGCKGHYDPYDIEMLSSHEECLIFKEEVTLGLVAGDLMSVEDWMGVPVVITVMVLSKKQGESHFRGKRKAQTREEGKVPGKGK